MDKSSDSIIGNNLTGLRGSMSMDLLAAKMRELGHNWTKTTVFNVEHGKRQLRLGEAADVLSCLGFGKTEMWRYFVGSQNKALVDSLDRVSELAEQVRTSIMHLLEERLRLVRVASMSDSEFDEDVEDLLEITSPSALFGYMKDEAGVVLSKWIAENSTNADESEEKESSMAHTYGPYWAYVQPSYLFDEDAFSKRQLETLKRSFQQTDDLNNSDGNGVDS